MTLEETDGHAIEALYFGDGTAFEEERAGRREIDVVYYPDINEYNGRKTLQAVIRRYKFRGKWHDNEKDVMPVNFLKRKIYRK